MPISIDAAKSRMDKIMVSFESISYWEYLLETIFHVVFWENLYLKPTLFSPK